jgi:hypothetical protein
MGMTEPEAARIAEQAREGMGMMIILFVLLFVAAWAFLARGGISRRADRRTMPA